MTMTMITALERLWVVLDKLDFKCPNINAHPSKERKMVRIFDEDARFNATIWTTVTGNGPAPKGEDSLHFLLVHKGLLWVFRDMKRYVGNFYARLERRAQTLVALGESRQVCPTHQSKMILKVDNQDKLYWVCRTQDCLWSSEVQPSIAKQVKKESTSEQWEMHKYEGRESL